MNPIVRALLLSVSLLSIPLSLVACSPTPATAVAVDETALSSSDAPHERSRCAIAYEDDAIIRGSVDRIWDTLVDLPRYSEWNPWVVSAEGKIEPGAGVTVQVVLNGHTQKAEHV